MECIKSFSVFGEKVEVFVTGEMTNGASAMLVQTSPPGGGPPPHRHSLEDEFFQVLDGDFELLRGDEWMPAPKGKVIFSARGSRHTFRNCGTATGRMLIVVAPAGLETYLEAISPLEMPKDAAQVEELSKQFGIEFLF
jgi:quercetin dioxygenase-like cupin family protein